MFALHNRVDGVHAETREKEAPPRLQGGTHGPPPALPGRCRSNGVVYFIGERVKHQVVQQCDPAVQERPPPPARQTRVAVLNAHEFRRRLDG